MTSYQWAKATDEERKASTLKQCAEHAASIEEVTGIDVRTLDVADLDRDDLSETVKDALRFDLFERRGLPTNEVLKPGESWAMGVAGGEIGEVWAHGFKVRYEDLKPARDRHRKAGATREEAARRAIIEVLLNGKAGKEAKEEEIGKLLQVLGSSFNERLEEGDDAE